MSQDLPSYFHTLAHAIPSRLLTFCSPPIHLLQFPFFKFQMKGIQPRFIWVLAAL